MSSFKPGIVSRSAASALNAAADRISGLSQSGVGAGEPRVGGVDGKYLHIPGTELTSDWWFAELTNAGSGSPPAHTWQEVVETAGGTWVAGDRSGGGAYQVAAAGGSSVAASSGSLVLMRASPTIVGLYEFVAVGGAGLNTQNTDGTEVDATTTDLRFNKTTGLKVTQSGGVSTVTGIDASHTQKGVVSTSFQRLGGPKQVVADTMYLADDATLTDSTWLTADKVAGFYFDDIGPPLAGIQQVRYEDSGLLTSVVGLVYPDPGSAIASAFAGDGTLAARVQHYATINAVKGQAVTTYNNELTPGTSDLGMTVGVWSDDLRGIQFCATHTNTAASFLSLAEPGTFTPDIYADPSEHSGGTGPIRCRQDYRLGDCKRYAVRRQPSGGGSYQDVEGVDHDFDVGQFPVVRGGIIVGYRTATGGSYGTIGSTATYPSITCSLLVAVAGGE